MDFNFDTSTISSLSTLEPNSTGALANVIVISGEGALAVPVGNTIQRPSNVDGGIRLNSDTSTLEYYTGAQWTSIQNTNTALTNLSNLSGTGLVVQTSSGEFATRIVEGTAGEITVGNESAVSGNIIVSLANTGVTAGTYVSVTVDSKGRVTAGNTTQAWSTITSTPTTANGYGITDVIQSDSVAELEYGLLSERSPAGTSGNLYIASDTNTLYFDTGAEWQLIQTAITGDVSIAAGGNIATLANVNSNIGTFNTVTVNSKGLVTAASNTSYLQAGDSPTITGNWTFSSNIFVPTPTNPAHAANKQYVDEVAQGIVVKPAVRVATVGDLTTTGNVAATVTYNNGTAGVGATLTIQATSDPGVDPITVTIDGYALSAQDATNFVGILIKDQNDAVENGRYYVSSVTSTTVVLTRCGLCDEANEIPSSYVFVNQGTTNAASGWVLTVADVGTFVVGTDDITVTQFSAAGSYSAGDGLQLVGSEFSVIGVSGQITVSNVGVGLDTVGTAGTYVSVTTDAYGRVTAGNTTQAWSTITGTPTTLSGYGIADAVIANSPITPGTYTKVTVDSKGLVTAGNTLIESDIPTLSWSKINANTTPTTLSGYGITDAVTNAGNTPSIQSGLESALPAAGTVGRLYIATDTKKIYRDNGATWVEFSQDLDLYTENPSSPSTSTVTGINAISLGSGNTASANVSLSTGSGAVSRAYGAETRATGFISAAGDAQAGTYILRGVTTGTGATEIFLDGTSEQIVLPNNSNWTFTIQITGRRAGVAGGRAGFEIRGVVYRDNGANTVAFQGTPSKTILSRTNSNLDANVGVNTTTGALTISVNGLGSQTFNWVAVVRTAEVIG